MRFSSFASFARGRTSRRWLVLASALAGLLAACTEPSIRVQLRLPDGVRVGAGGDIRSATLRVLESSSIEPLSCDDIAFGTVSEDTIRARMLQEVTVRAGTDLDLVGIPRLGQKLFWVEALDAQQSPVVAGCESIGDIEGDAEITIVGQPTAVLTLDAPTTLGAPLPDSVPAFVTDSRGVPLSDIDVIWTVVGPGDIRIEGTVRTDNGVATITPEIPVFTGPTLLDVRARWQRTATPPIAGFQPAQVMFDDVLPGASDARGLVRTNALYTVGSIGPAGEMGFAALGPPAEDTGERMAVIAYRDARATENPFATVLSAPIAGATTIGRIRRQGRDAVIVAAGLSWFELTLQGELSFVRTVGQVTRRLVSIGDCERDSTKLLAVTGAGANEPDIIAVYDVSAQGVLQERPDDLFALSSPTSQILGTGCVSQIGGSEVRTVVYNTGIPERSLLADTEPRTIAGQLSSYTGSVGFTPGFASEPATVVATSIDTTGVTMSRYQLSVGEGDAVEPVLIGDDPSLTFLRNLRGGDMDGDGRADVIGLLDFGVDDTGASQVRLQIALGTEYRGQRLIGVSQALPADDPQLYIADFDGDGADDVLVAGRAQVRILRGRRP